MNAPAFDVRAAALRLHVNNVTTREQLEIRDWHAHLAAQVPSHDPHACGCPASAFTSEQPGLGGEGRALVGAAS